MTQTKTFRFWQNNSGGGWADIEPVTPNVRTDGHDVYIEAESSDEADKIAEANGIYFGGVSEGIDCECCGDRWYRAGWPESEDEDE